MNVRNRKANWLLVGIIVLAVCLRTWGVGFGLPYLYHPDEPVSVAIAQNMFKTGDLNPHFFDWPSLTFYLNALTYIPYYLVGKLVGVFHGRSDIPSPISLAMGTGWISMPTVWLLGRMLTVMFGSASVVLVFLLGRKSTHNTAVGLLAAMVMAISPTAVAHSRYITPDTFAVFFTLLSFWGAVQVLRHAKPWHYIVAGVGSGLAASAKYNGALIVLAFVVAHFLRCGIRGLKKPYLYLALLLSVGTFLVTTPFAVLDYREFLGSLRYDVGHYSTGHPGMEGNSLFWYLRYLWRVEGPAVAFAVVEILHSTYKRSKQSILTSAFSLVYFASISSFEVRNERTLLLLMPFLFLSASSLLVHLAKQADIQRAKRILAVCMVGVMVAVLLALPVSQTIRQTVQLTIVDSRETARTWIDDHLPVGSRIALESYAPYIDPQRFSVQGFGKMIDHTAEWYVAEGFDYLVFSQGMFGRFYREPNRYSNEISQYEELFHTFDVVKVFTDGGYEVRVYRISH